MAPVFIRPPYIPKGKPIDGIILLDSFGMAGQMEKKGPKSMYTQDALQYVYWRTGLYCLGIQHNGAGYANLLEAAYVMRRKLKTDQGGMKVSFCVIISMGNDIYKYTRVVDEGIDLGLPERIASGMEKVHQYSQEYLANATLIVYGGASKTWNYNGIQAERYDSYVESTIMKILQYANVIQGLSLGRLDTVDSIGHVNVSSLKHVVNTFVLWVLLAAGLPLGEALYYAPVQSKL